MWISKKKWNEMNERIWELEKNSNKYAIRITELDEKLYCYDTYKKNVEKLLDAHLCDYSDGFQEIRGGNTVRYYSRILKEINHNNLNFPSNKVKDVTLEELTRLVIDGEPIVRKTMEEKTNYYGGSGIVND